MNHQIDSFVSTTEYEEGNRAYRKGLSLSDNPYEKGSLKAKDWEVGYADIQGYEMFCDGRWEITNVEV